MKFPRKPQTPAAPVRSLFTATLPALDGTPLLRIELGLDSTPRGDGEETHLRMHLLSRLANAARAPAPAAIDGSRRTPRLPARRATALVQRSLKSRLVQRLAAPLLRHDFQTWVDIKASTVPLLQGAGALLPGYVERLHALGIDVAGNAGSVVQSWSGLTHGARPGLAQFTLLRLDKRHLPAALASLLGARPFQAVATVAQIIEARNPDPTRTTG